MKTLSIVLPVYNEEDRLEKTFSTLRNFAVPRGLKLEKIIFVDDGSTDGTKLKIKKYILNSSTVEGALSGHPRGVLSAVKIILVSYKQNKGKGYAVARGMNASDSDYTLFLDADMSTDINEIRKFMPAVRRGVPVIIGTRKNGGSTVVRHQPFIRESLGKVFTFISNIVLDTWVTDFTCGFKAFSKEAKDTLFPCLKVNDWGFDAELLFLGRISGFEFAEVPVIWSDDRRSKVKLWKDIPKSILDLLYIRLMSFSGSYEIKSLKPNPALSFVKVLKSYLF